MAYALYYGGKLIGVITDAAPYGSIEDICDALSPDQGICDYLKIADAMATSDPPCDGDDI